MQFKNIPTLHNMKLYLKVCRKVNVANNVTKDLNVEKVQIRILTGYNCNSTKRDGGRLVEIDAGIL
jgi:hypothetical protein